MIAARRLAGRRFGWRLHARTRLTLWYSLLLAGTLVLLGGAALLATERALYAALDDGLRARAAGFEAVVGHELGEGERASAREMVAQASGLDLLRAWDSRGRWLFGVEDGARLAAPASAAPDHANGDTFGMERLASGATVRVLTHSLRDGNRVVGVVQVGRTTAEAEGVLSTLRSLGLAGLAVAVALAWLGGAFLARRALAPVERVAQEAAAIQADDLSRRLALDLPDDEMGRLARAFDAMIARLEAAFERQRRFTADASHELRTPLGIIRSQVDVALGAPRTAEQYAEVLREVRAETDRLTRLTERLLTLARADGRETLTMTRVDLQDLAAEAAAGVAMQARTLGVRLDLGILDVPEVDGDPIWLTQLLYNLLDNALRHTPAGGSVTLTLRTDDDGAVLIRVADSGSGIAPEHLPHLFERFYRTDEGRARASGGAGLGLAICDWVARAHGGTITVESTFGAGTRFTVRLPAAAPAPHPTPSSAPACRSEAPNAVPAGSHRLPVPSGSRDTRPR